MTPDRRRQIEDLYHAPDGLLADTQTVIAKGT
jgi:hypothetical protein